ncbi:hypothetical protein [Streptomyces sp. NPDC048442]|uniref:hypothetical protein n=1 Tax=Streptomyces sp. NPDC048442 TaxID=3154823 RepID=UPI003424C60D
MTLALAAPDSSHAAARPVAGQVTSRFGQFVRTAPSTASRKIGEVEGPSVMLPATRGETVTATAVCPAGTQGVGGGFTHGTRTNPIGSLNTWFWGSKADLPTNSWKVS